MTHAHEEDENELAASVASPAVTPVAVSVKPFEAAMRQLTRVDVAQYLLSNTRSRSSGAAKALAHASLTISYVAVLRDIDPDRVRRRCETDYKAVHDATADELTSHLDRAIGFDFDAPVDDEVAERFFLAFHKIALRILSPSIIPATKGGEGGVDWDYRPDLLEDPEVGTEPPLRHMIGHYYREHMDAAKAVEWADKYIAAHVAALAQDTDGVVKP